MKITFTGDPMDGKEKVIGIKRIKRYSDEHEREVTVRRPIKRTHKAQDPESIVMHGMKFVKGEAVEVPDSSEFAKQYGHKFEVNSHFKVEKSKAKSKPKSKAKAKPQDGNNPPLPAAMPTGE